MAQRRSSRCPAIYQAGLFDEIEAVDAQMPGNARLPQDSGQESASADSDIFFMSFGSGSSGNCSYVGDETGGFLIDAGVDPKTVLSELRRNGVSPEMVRGVILTHDHGDHVRYVYAMVRACRHVLVYCTPKALSGIMRRHNVSRRLYDYHRPVYKEFPFKIGAFEITAFEVSHDGTDNAGYFIRRGDHTFAVATDLGCITDRVNHYMRRARYVVLEANYDAGMLAAGSYPEFLKARIAAFNGHLDNEVAGKFLADIYTPYLRAVFLCHLSHDNNTPEVALAAVSSALVSAHPDLTIGDGSNSVEDRAAPFHLVALPRYDATPLYRLR